MPILAAQWRRLEIYVIFLKTLIDHELRLMRWIRRRPRASVLDEAGNIVLNRNFEVRHRRWLQEQPKLPENL
jgi:hypothetical protein